MKIIDCNFGILLNFVNKTLNHVIFVDPADAQTLSQQRRGYTHQAELERLSRSNLSIFLMLLSRVQ